MLFRSATGPVRNPNFSVMQYRTAGGDSYYHGFQSVLNRRLSAGLQFQASYTFSKSIDTGSVQSFSSEGLNTVVMQSLFDPNEGERGVSSFDARHVSSMSATYELPFGKEWGGAAKAIASGWQLGGILNLGSGHPFTPILGSDNARVSTRSRGDHLRPDLRPGANANPVEGSSAGCGTNANPALNFPAQEVGTVKHYFDPCSFILPNSGVAGVGILGNLGRNTLVGPGLAQVDFTMKKKFNVSENNFFEFRMEVFNIFNRANFRDPADTERTILDGNGNYNLRSGEITGTTTSARQIQFSLRYEF